MVYEKQFNITDWKKEIEGLNIKGGAVLVTAGKERLRLRSARPIS